MTIIKNGILVEDVFKNVIDLDALSDSGPVLISLDQWREHRSSLLASGRSIGILLLCDQHPKKIAEDIHYFDLIALDFPVFRDGRAYSYARLLRERYNFTAELRAVGEVLLDQLHYMHRVGFNAFDIDCQQPLIAWRVAVGKLSVCYQPAADSHPTATALRHQSI